MTAVSVASSFGQPQPLAPRAARSAGLPWELGDLMRVTALNSVVWVALLVAWYGVSGTSLLSEAAAWTVLGIGAIIVQGCANIAWLLRGRRTFGERRARLLAGLEQLPELVALSAVALSERGTLRTIAPVAPPEPVGALVAVTGATRYHRPDCQLARGKRVVDASREEHRRASRVPCGVCEP